MYKSRVHCSCLILPGWGTIRLTVMSCLHSSVCHLSALSWCLPYVCQRVFARPQHRQIRLDKAKGLVEILFDRLRAEDEGSYTAQLRDGRAKNQFTLVFVDESRSLTCRQVVLLALFISLYHNKWRSMLMGTSHRVQLSEGFSSLMNWHIFKVYFNGIT